MKKWNIEVWLPEGQFCNDYGDEICQFFNGGFCILLGNIMVNNGLLCIKLAECPSWGKYKK